MKDDMTPEQRDEFWASYPGDAEAAMRKMAMGFTPKRADMDALSEVKTVMFNDVLRVHRDWFMEHMPAALVDGNVLDDALEGSKAIITAWMEDLHGDKMMAEQYVLMAQSIVYTREYLWGDTGLQAMTRQFIVDNGWLNTPMGTLAAIELVLVSEMMTRTFHRMSFMLCNNREVLAYEFHKAAGNYNRTDKEPETE